MKRLRNKCTKASFTPAGMLAALLITMMSFGKTDLPVFLLSGQSNIMAYHAGFRSYRGPEKKR